MSDNLILDNQTFLNVAGFKVVDTNNNILTYVRPQGTKTITTNGTGIDVAQYATVDVDVPSVNISQDQDGYMVMDSSGNGDSSSSLDFGQYLDIDITGMDIVYQNQNIQLDGTSIINTGIQLFSASNINKDFKVIMKNLYADNTTGTDNAAERTVISSKYEVSPYPGIAMRATGTVQPSVGSIQIANQTLYPMIVIARTNGEYQVSAMAGLTLLNTGGANSAGYTIGIGNFNSSSMTQHDIPFVIGGALQADGVTAYRKIACSMDSIIIAIEN